MVTFSVNYYSYSVNDLAKLLQRFSIGSLPKSTAVNHSSEAITTSQTR